MAELFTEQYSLMWAVILAAALFFPVRKLIWVLMIRRAQRAAAIEEAEIERLKRRAGFTTVLLVFIFAYSYTKILLSGMP